MKRKRFITTSSLGMMGGLLLPNLLLSCQGKAKNEFDGQVIIIGAGSAGLYAAYLLKEQGIKCSILEASGRYGGRVKKLTGFADIPLDLGAQWLHERNSIVGKLVNSTKTKIYAEEADSLFWYKGKIVNSLPNKAVANLTEKENLPDLSLQDYALKQGWNNSYDNILEALAGEYGASADNLSAFYSVAEFSNEQDENIDYRFLETYYDFLDENIAAKVQDLIKLNTVVTKIDYRNDKIIVTDRRQQTYTADKVIITVPITILKSGDIEFIPTLPSAKINAFQKIGMEDSMKVFLKFNKRFYRSDFVIGGSICGTYYDESKGKGNKDHILLAFIMGKQAKYLNSLGSDQAIFQALLKELDSMYAQSASKNFIQGYVQNWTKDPFIRGGYSYPLVGMGNARKIAAQPLENKLFFAGEAMNINGHSQQVHGAIETGFQVVKAILNTSS